MTDMKFSLYVIDIKNYLLKLFVSANSFSDAGKAKLPGNPKACGS
jgi:hypothetical protein